jgi:site-specific recombinase XerD
MPAEAHFESVTTQRRRNPMETTAKQAAQTPGINYGSHEPFSSNLLAFKRYLRVIGRSEATIRLYDRILQRYARFLADDLGFQGGVEASKRDHFEEWQERGMAAGRSAHTLISRRQAIYVYFKWLVEVEELLKDNPLRKVRAPKAEMKVVEILTDDQQRLLLKKASEGAGIKGLRNRAIVQVLLDAGLRAGELIRLNRGKEGSEPVPSDLDEEAGTLFIRTSKTGRQRIVALGDESLLRLRRYLRARKDTGEALFVGVRGKRLSRDTLHSLIKRLGQTIGAPTLHPHVLRHCSASAAADDGATESNMRIFFGWSRTSKMPSHYTAANAEKRAQDYFRSHSCVDRLLHK